jgi:hypothetical protein
MRTLIASVSGISAFFLAPLVIVSWVQAADEISVCRSLKDKDQRLACFDRTTAPRPAADGETIGITDFLLDAKELSGKKVVVEGVLQAFAGMTFLKKDLVGADFATVQVDNLPRTQRKAILEKCDQGCNATVDGIARVEYSQKIIQARDIQIRD